MKKIFLCFLLLISVGLFTGCTTVNGVNYVNTDISSIYVVLNYDEDNLSSIGIDAENEISLVKDDIEEKASLYMDQMLQKYKDIINYLNANELLSDNEKIIYKNHLNFYSGWDNENYVIEFRFYSKTASRIFVKYAGETEGAVITNNLFTTKVTERYTEIFSKTPDDIITNTLEEYFNDSLDNVILDNFGETAKNNFSGISVNYMFLTTNSRIHSNGEIINTTQGPVHLFEDSEENVFEFYRIEANRYVWYLFALTITMVFLAIGLMVVYFKKDKKGLKNDQNDSILKF